ncbi:HNH endonuclease, partial [Acinetobacter baumannii]
RALLVLSHKSDNQDPELAKFARRHRQSLLVEPLKRHQRPNPTKMSEAEYARNMFEDIQAFNAIKTRTQTIDTQLYFTDIKF